MSNFDILAPFGRRWATASIHCSKDSLPCKVGCKGFCGRLRRGCGPQSGSASSVSRAAARHGLGRGALPKTPRSRPIGQQLVGACRAGGHDGAAAGRRLEQRRGEALGVLGGQTVGVRPVSAAGRSAHAAAPPAHGYRRPARRRAVSSGPVPARTGAGVQPGMPLHGLEPAAAAPFSGMSRPTKATMPAVRGRRSSLVRQSTAVVCVGQPLASSAGSTALGSRPAAWMPNVFSQRQTSPETP